MSSSDDVAAPVALPSSSRATIPLSVTRLRMSRPAPRNQPRCSGRRRLLTDLLHSQKLIARDADVVDAEFLRVDTTGKEVTDPVRCIRKPPRDALRECALLLSCGRRSGEILSPPFHPPRAGRQQYEGP